jgi:enoyl-CoA hydratase
MASDLDVSVATLMSTDTLVLKLSDGVAELTLTRPDILNRFDVELHSDFVDALIMLRDLDGFRCLVLASTGRAFSAGGDFELMRKYHDDVAARSRLLDEGRRLTSMMIDFPLPVVVAVQGDALGLGSSIVLACDVVVAARAARLGDPHVAVGLVAGDGGCVMWPQITGILRAKRYLLTGDLLPAEVAETMGLVTDLVDGPDDALPYARGIARRIAALPPMAVRGTKQALSRIMQQRAGEVLELAVALEAMTLASDDLLEAIAAFKERRPGNYVGH